MRLITIFSFLLFTINSLSQIQFQKGYFGLPTKIDFKISSNFGEIRPNHFHAGLDVWTKVKSGINYYSVADGYISRILVSPRGLGNSLYITHPNGYVTVFAHMSKFRDDITEYIYKLQHNKQQFEQDVYPLPHLFPLKKGDYIGKSGNSGNSYGAHLHFEIREEDSEIPVNPLFAYNIRDNVAPRVNKVYMYRFDNELYRYVAKESLSKINGRTIRTFGKTGFGLEIHDYITGNGNRFGAYQLELFIDDSLYFSSKMDKISFYETRYLNSFADYKEREITRRKISKCFIEPNNKLGVYQTKSNGLFDFSDGKLHKVKIVGKDIKGNAVTINFKVLSDSTKKLKPTKPGSAVVKKIDCFKQDTFETDSFKIFFHRNCLYHNIDLTYFTTTNKRGGYSKLHHIHNRYVPIHNKVTICIKPDSIPADVRNKAIIAGISKRGNIYAAGGEWNGEFIEAKVKNFGTYFVTIDNTKPVIRSLSVDKYKRVRSGKLKFKITDNLSGIKEYIGYIDDKWVLFEYDQKNNLISCNLTKEKIAKGKHEVVLWVTDYSGNIATYETNLTVL